MPYLCGELTNMHTKQHVSLSRWPSFLVRGIAQTVKGEKDISNESNSLGSKLDKTREDIGTHNL